MYDFYNSTDTLKFWTEKWAINKTFVFHPILMKIGEIVVHMGIYNFANFLSKSDEKQKRFINSPFFCSEFQSVSRIVIIVHSGTRREGANEFSKILYNALPPSPSIKMSSAVPVYDIIGWFLTFLVCFVDRKITEKSAEILKKEKERIIKIQKTGFPN